MTQTAVEWFANQLGIKNGSMLEQAKEMEKQQIIDANYDGQRLHSKSCTKQMLQDNAESYFAETYGSKGSDEHIGDTNKMICTDDNCPHCAEDIAQMQDDEINDIIKNDTSVMLVCEDCGMETCDCGLTDDEIIIRDLHKQLTSSQTEISDEEIYKEAEHKSKIFRGWTEYETSAWVMACQWYREQLKKK